MTACRELILKKNIKWIHGYPSSVFSFLRELEAIDPLLFEILIKKVQGVFLGSEYPAPQYRHYIEKHCGLKSISWYGHSEMAVLASEREPGSGVYYPFHSYGYTEAVPAGNSYRLVGTSTYNYATPMIRYDTGDLIEPTFEDGLLEAFRIKEGRNSETVIDLKGRNISLTGLIFGRHHKAFDHSEHIQVRQISPGKIEIFITSKGSICNWQALFDFSNSFFDVSFKNIDSPIRTPSGKVQLLLRPE
jgi:phenylacetate-CoA ligase